MALVTDHPERTRPLVTVVTAVLDAASTIGATLESVASQTVQDLEHIVVDGGSTDGTLSIVRAARRPVRLVSDSDHGIYDAFNRGLALARGRWINFLNADDTFAHPRVLERVLAEAARAPEVAIFHGDVDYVDGGRVVGQGRFLGGREDLGLDADNCAHHQTTFMRREVFERFGGFDATFALSGDYDLLLRAHLAGVQPRHIPDVFVRMGVGGRSADQRAVRLEFMRSWWRRTGRFPWRHLLRFTKAHVLDVHAPGASAALGAVKRAVWPRRAVRRHDEV
jgi:glycosyltransferase